MSQTLSLTRRLIEAVEDFLFPPTCLHCRLALEYDEKILCAACLQLVELIDSSERCERCFHPLHKELSEGLCLNCERSQSSLAYFAVALPYTGPAQTLVRALKYGNLRYLGKAGGAFLLAQYAQLNWPTPDVIVPVPITLGHYFRRSFNQSEILAELLAETIECPVNPTLHRLTGDWSQAGLSREQRLALTTETFVIRPNADLEGRMVLLIDDVVTTGTTLERCAEVLREHFSCQVMGLALCGNMD